VPTSLSASPQPPGAISPGTSVWYRARAPGPRLLVLGVYRPTTPSATPPIAAIVLHGNDGFRRQYESLAARFARNGMIGIVACWFDRPEQPLSDAPDAIACSGGPTFKGAKGGVPDLNAIVAAADQISDVDPARMILVGHSYGATVALDRAATGMPQPVVSSAGLLARSPAPAGPPPASEVLPSDPGMPALIDVPVMLAHGMDDPIIPIAQATTFATLLTNAGNPPVTRYYSGVGHSFPFIGPYVGRFGIDVAAWVATLTFV
jgi:dienelactone hydrolase